MGEELKLWQFLAVQFPLGVLLVIYTLALVKLWGSHEEYLYSLLTERLAKIESELKDLSRIIREQWR